MHKLFTLSLLSLTSLTALSACGPIQMSPAQLQPQQLRSQSAPNQSKASSESIKAGSKAELQINQSKGQAKPVITFEIRLEPSARDLSTSEVMRIARLGLDSMERASSYESGYNIGRSTLDSLSRHNAYIARLAIAATNPEMKYESAYKATAKALAFIANNREITIPNACDLVRDMMNHAKSYEDGSRIGYGTMGFIRQTASASIRTLIDSSVRSAQTARYWEDSYNILYSAYGSIRYMN